MPTIYDILPSLEDRILSLLHDFMAEDGGAFHTWEVAVLLPGSNGFVHFMAGVNLSLKNGNYVSSMANLRGMIEVLGAVVYDGTASLPKEGYDRFLKTGRLPKWDEEAQKWIDLGPRESVKYAQMVVDAKTNLKKIYDDCCDLLHFSSIHMSFMGGFEQQGSLVERLAKIKIGSKDQIPIKLQRDMIDLCAELATGLGKCITLGIEEKKKRNTPKPS
ncbi:MAG TPA: hypothetical protein VMT30_04335 [Candidatus Saccharimonadia bacterium]|nr:hypothetical protein [Candidatus Saccharimonadia bacterium]